MFSISQATLFVVAALLSFGAEAQQQQLVKCRPACVGDKKFVQNVKVKNIQGGTVYVPHEDEAHAMQTALTGFCLLLSLFFGPALGSGTASLRPTLLLKGPSFFWETELTVESFRRHLQILSAVGQPKQSRHVKFVDPQRSWIQSKSKLLDIQRRYWNPASHFHFVFNFLIPNDEKPFQRSHCHIWCPLVQIVLL
jgi:hypothetical protein